MVTKVHLWLSKMMWWRRVLASIPLICQTLLCKIIHNHALTQFKLPTEFQEKKKVCRVVLILILALILVLILILALRAAGSFCCRLLLLISLQETLSGLQDQTKSGGLQLHAVVLNCLIQES